MQLPISVLDDSLQCLSIPVINGRSKQHAGNPCNSNRTPSSHAWQYHEMMAVHHIAPYQHAPVWGWYQDMWIHSLMHHEPTRVFYQHGFRFRRNVQGPIRQPPVWFCLPFQIQHPTAFYHVAYGTGGDRNMEHTGENFMCPFHTDCSDCIKSHR